MPGFVQMLERDLEGLDDLDAVEPSPLLGAVIQQAASLPEVQAWLREVGRFIARKGLGELKEMVTGRPTPPSPWVATILPLLDPVEDGIMEVLRRKARPWAIGLAAITGLAGIGVGALIGRGRRRAYERGRREVG